MISAWWLLLFLPITCAIGVWCGVQATSGYAQDRIENFADATLKMILAGKVEEVGRVLTKALNKNHPVKKFTGMLKDELESK